MKITKLLILIIFPLWGLGGFAQEELSKEEVDKIKKKEESEKKEEKKNRKIMMIGLGIVVGFVLLIVILCELAY